MDYKPRDDDLVPERINEDTVTVDDDENVNKYVDELECFCKNIYQTENIEQYKPW